MLSLQKRVIWFDNVEFIKGVLSQNSRHGQFYNDGYIFSPCFPFLSLPLFFGVAPPESDLFFHDASSFFRQPYSWVIFEPPGPLI